MNLQDLDLNPWTFSGSKSQNQPEANGQKVTAASLETWINARLDWQRKQIDQLTAGDPERIAGPRTVENTLSFYDDAVATLSAAGSQASLLDSVYPDKEVRDKARELTQKVAEAGTALSLNQEVFRALEAMDLSQADPATQHYVAQTLLNYRLAGVDKDEPTRLHLRELSDRATELSLAFSNNVQENVNRVEVRDASELDGLPADYIRNHPPDASGTIVLTTDYPDMQPVMTFARSADLRLRMFRAYNTRAYPANRQVLLDLLKVRHEIASILGFASWADLATANQLIGSAANMKTFIGELEQASRKGAQREYGMVLEFARQHQPGLTALKSSDRGYWYEQYRRAAFDFDSQAVRPYFPYDRVEKGILQTAQRLFHVRFERAAEAEVWHPSVTAWDVYDRGQPVGRFYLDMHPREGKDKWFSAAPLIPGIRGRQQPQAALICNFPGGKPGDPGLMQYSDVVTFFHEFGHLMHAILGGQQQWAGVSGIATEGDFVEVPSQMLEEFFHDPQLLATFARHYETDEPIPEALVERMNRASAFGRADGVRTQLFYTSYSLDVHNRPPEEIDPDAMLEEGYKRLLPYEWVDGNRMYASFTHLTGYSSNYYTYMFDKVIALDFFSQFDRSNLLEGPTAMRYRQAILEPGGSKPGRMLIQDFLGRQQTMDAFERWIGEEFGESQETAAPAGGRG
ncbi:MAG TPA: M3 family metallopeptidase [Acidobacteriaceae bacterium]|nr:M3 family metallopeptidase [Acidobacteriaceae bacterium]